MRPFTAGPARRLAKRLLRDSSGVSVIEFAYIVPIFATLGLLGTEIAWMSTVNMQASQIALSLADNASRLGQTDNSSVTPTITEADVDSIMAGAMRQGASINLGAQGRVVLSSLEYHKGTGKQYIHWQRCRGSLVRASAYGNDGANNGLGGTTIAGVGQSATKVRAADGSAVMVAEVYYQYDGLFANMLSLEPMFRQEAVFAIRDDRNLAPGVTGTNGQSRCT